MQQRVSTATTKKRYKVKQQTTCTSVQVVCTRHNGKGHAPTGKHWHNLIPNACFHISCIGVRVMVYSVTLARIDILPEDGRTVTETCRRFHEILAF